jgi:hypothetical protein
MATSAKGAGMTWRDKVKTWFSQVAQEARLTRDWETAARRNGSSFPQSLLVKILRAFIGSLARWIVKSALRDAASHLGVALTDAQLDVLTDVAVALA